MLKSIMIVTAIGLTLSGCATKRYGRMQPLSGIERAQLDCDQINIELSRVEAFQIQLTEGSEFNAASALGLLGDFGIGNSMEKGAAERSAVQRLAQLRELQAEQGCV